MKITELNDHCLYHILERLSFCDLFNTAKSNQRLNVIAGQVFSHKYGRSLIKVGKSSIKTFENVDITVADLSTIESFFSHFGSFITKLQIVLIGIDYMQIESFISQNSRESLIELNLFYGRSVVLERIEKSFTNVEKLSISGGILNRRISRFEKWFPNIRSLELCCVDFDGDKCIQSTFTHLSNFKLQYNGNFTRLKSVIKPNLKEMFRLNPQICTLHTSFFYLYEKFDNDFYQCISHHLPNLKYFELHDESNFDGDIIKFNNVEIFKLKCNWSNPLPIFHFNQLEEFYFDNMPEIDDKFINFIASNRHLRKLSLNFAEDDFEFTQNDFLKLSQLQNLNEFQLKMTIDTLAASTIQEFLSQCKSMRKLQLKFEFSNKVACETFHRRIVENISNKWNLVEVNISERCFETIFQQKCVNQ